MGFHERDGTVKPHDTAFLLAFSWQALFACSGDAYKLGRAGSGGTGGEPGDSDSAAGGPAVTPGFGANDGGPALTSETARIVENQPGGVAFVVADEDYVYFNTWGGPIWRAGHDGSGRVELAGGITYHLAADETAVYYSSENGIRRVAKGGGPSELVLTPSSSGRVPAHWITLDDSYIYAATYEGQTVERAYKTGGQDRVLVYSDQLTAGVAVARGTLFWADYGGASVSNINRVDLSTGIGGRLYPSSGAMLRAVGEDIWFTLPGNGPLLNTALVRVPLGGGPVTEYSSFGTYSIYFGNDDTHVYWMKDFSLSRIDVATGNEQLVARLEIVDPETIAVTREWVFVSDASNAGGLLRVRKPAP
jgi:hypothetical protein